MEKEMDSLQKYNVILETLGNEKSMFEREEKVQMYAVDCLNWACLALLLGVCGIR